MQLSPIRHPIETRNVQINVFAPVIAVNPVNPEERPLARKSKRIAKIKEKQTQVEKKPKQQTKSKNLKRKRLHRVKSASNLLLIEGEIQQRTKTVQKRKILQKSKKPNVSTRQQDQRQNQILLSSGSNEIEQHVQAPVPQPRQTENWLISQREGGYYITQSWRSVLGQRRNEIPHPAQRPLPSRRQQEMLLRFDVQDQSPEINANRVQRQRSNIFDMYFSSEFSLFNSMSGQVQKQNLEWFISKNKTYPYTNLTSIQIQKCDKCIICYSEFLDPKENGEQKCSPLEQMKPQAEKEQLETTLLMELFCEHIYHKSCIQNWFKTNKNCPCCRKDFRKHDAYKEWDVNYEKRIKQNCQTFLDNDINDFYRPQGQRFLLQPLFRENDIIINDDGIDNPEIVDSYSLL